MKIGSSSSSYSIYKTMVMARAKRKAVNERLDLMNAVGSTMFSAKVSQAQGLSQIAAKQYADRVMAAAKAKLQSATKIS